MSDLRKAAEMALEALKDTHYRIIDAGLIDQDLLDRNFTVATALRQALAQPEQECTCSSKDMPFGKCCKVKLEQEPVAWMYTLNDQVGEIASTVGIKRFDLSVTSPYGRQGIDYAQVMTVKEFPLYTAPPKKEWVGLTDEEIYEHEWWDEETAFAVNKKLKEKNT
jgi:hypothetical protein